MKAQNLTVSIPYKGCDKNCPYCISKITWSPEVNSPMIFRNLPKVVKLAETANVTSVLLTGKGEPFLNMSDMRIVAEVFTRAKFPIEIQTNGVWLNKELHSSEVNRQSAMSKIREMGINVIAFSIDKLHQLDQYSDTFDILRSNGVIIRICLNLTKMIGYSPNVLAEVLERINKSAVRQILFRNITIVHGASEETPTAKWITENTSIDDYHRMVGSFRFRLQGRVIRILPETGTEIYDVDGVSVCFSDYCIQQTNKSDDIRSLIFHQDGHVYTSWDSPASILF